MVPPRIGLAAPDQVIAFEPVWIIVSGAPGLADCAEDEPFTVMFVVSGRPIASPLGRNAEDAVDVGSGIRPTNLELAMDGNNSWLGDYLEAESSQDTKAA